jgi:hypothetical protein
VTQLVLPLHEAVANPATIEPVVITPRVTNSLISVINVLIMLLTLLVN